MTIGGRLGLSDARAYEERNEERGESGAENTGAEDTGAINTMTHA